jgi:hypothetical protein
MAAAVPRPMSRWDLPVPESPIRHSGDPAVTQSQVARVLMTAGLTLGFGVVVEVGQPFRAGEPGGAQPPLGPAVVAVLAFGHEHLGEEPAVGQLVFLGLVGGISELGADGGQAQDPAGGVDRRVGGLLGDASCTGHGQPSWPVRGWRSSWSYAPALGSGRVSSGKIRPAGAASGW